MASKPGSKGDFPLDTSGSDSEPELIDISEDGDLRHSIDAARKKSLKLQLACLRCETPQTFKDVEVFRVHIERHLVPDIFSCKTCQRPFLQLTHCLSHEFRVHGTPIPSPFSSPILTRAVKYVEEKRNDKDPEDVWFYKERFHPSTMIYPYRGPEVNHPLECCEVEFYIKREKQSDAKKMSKIALDRHRENVRRGWDKYRLGRFGAPKTYRGMPGPSAQISKPTDLVKRKQSTRILNKTRKQ